MAATAMVTTAGPTGAVSLDAHVRRWVERGLITPEQGRRILAEEHGETAAAAVATGPTVSEPGPAAAVATPAPGLPVTVPTTPSGSLVTEALGYVGGILILIAAMVIGGLYFDDLGRVGRLAVTLTATTALVVAGFLVPVAADRPATGRLRSVLWVLAVMGTGLFTGLLADQTFHLAGEEVAFVTSAATTLGAAELWRRHRWLPQQAAVLVGLAVALGSGTAAFLGDGGSDASGLAIWGLGGVWLMLGWGRHLRPRYGTDLLGGITLSVGSEITMEHDWGSVLAVASAVLLVLAGVRLRSLVLLAVGSLATLGVVPGVMQRYFPDTVAAPLALLAVGIVLVLAARATTKGWGRHRGTGVVARREPAPLPGLGVPTIAGFAVVVAVAVALLAVT
ncbi:DUF2157 domain-containing protein [Pedococcus sp. 2YAF34]|uniref:DUF2157 domain-containing protein n=1 Tax=Pedococcus sp. 2YAF34 TaxID=3233032 RepID=UPI003F9C05F7